jgi:hypothetical protein
MYIAIFGLVGVLIGALITAGSNYLLERRRERAVSQREFRNYAIERKRAARLIDAELLRSQAAVRISIEQRHWWSEDVPQLLTDAWQKYGGIIARDLSDQAWLEVTVAIEAVDNIRRAREIAVEAGLGAKPISESTADQLATMLTDIQLGRGALAAFALDVRPAPGSTR